MYLVLSEFVDDGLMQQKANVFDQVEGPWGRGALVHFLLVFGLVWVDAFENTQTPENIMTMSILKHVSMTRMHQG